MKPIQKILFIAALLCCPTTDALAQNNWDRFHGPNGSGVALGAKLPEQWAEENVQWHRKLDGIGSSSPVIWGDHLFITYCEPQSGELTLECFDTDTGESNWHQKFQLQPYQLHARNNFASATPAVDEKHVYLSFADPAHTMLVALTHDGKPVWQRDLGTWVSQHGFSISPMVHADKVIIFNSQQADQLPAGVIAGTSRVIAVNRNDGTDVWTTQLTATRVCYSMLSEFRTTDGKIQLIGCNTGDGFFSLDPETGKKNWTHSAFTQRVVSSTVVAGGVVLGSCGSGSGGNVLVAIRPDSTSPTEAPTEIYRVQKSNYVPSPVAVGGSLFMFNDKGVGTCVDLQTGKQRWQQRISSGFSSSPVATSDAIYVLDEDGILFIIAASNEYKLLGKHPLGESTRATPAIARDQIFLRTDSQLFCVGQTLGEK